jgi:hypothetical protein
MPIDIDRLTVDELIALNRRIVERLKFLESAHAHHEMMAFNLGDRVSFDAGPRGRKTGTLIKFNRKTVTVLTEDGHRWNVAPHLLSAIRDVGPDNASIVRR